MSSIERERPSSRLLVIDEEKRLLLFKFAFEQGALAGSVFWATPGGELEPGESYEEAAKRELFEETGLLIDKVDKHIEEKSFVLPLPEGGHAQAIERFYVIKIEKMDITLNQDNLTELEKQVMTEHKWWRLEDLRDTTDTVYPEDLAEILVDIL